MAPSVRGANARVSKNKHKAVQPTLRSFGKVSKASVAPLQSKKSATKEAATAAPAQVSTPVESRTNKNAKRRRDEDSEDEALDRYCPGEMEAVRGKKARLQLSTPPPSSQSCSEAEFKSSPDTPTFPSLQSLRLATTPKKPITNSRPTTPAELPQSLQNIISIHEVFLKALSIHYAHNGPATPAELTTLLQTITSLWKKHRVVKEDMQRMLALYEISDDPNVWGTSTFSIQHNVSPFKLTTSGVRTCVEYVGSYSTAEMQGFMHIPFNETRLQMRFTSDVMTLFLSAQTKSSLSFLTGAASDFPLLACSVGAQTAARKEKASVLRAEILNLSAAAQKRKQPKPATSADEGEAEELTEAKIEEKVKSRTQSLFDRVKAKQLANANNTTPTAEAILRRHAIGRVAEVVEILRMKQQQKMSASFVSAIHDSPSKMKSKVSFSLNQLVNEIRQSVAVPIGEEEARLCVKLVAGEVSRCWVNLFEMGSGEGKITSVVLSGLGMGGREVQKVLEEREKERGM